MPEKMRNLEAADLIESLAAELEITEAVAAQARGLECERDLLAAELEHVKCERDGLQMELDELKEEYYTGIHTARNPMMDKIKQLERERDTAVENLKLWNCFSCKNAGYSHSEICASCVYNRVRLAKGYISGRNRYEWRGVKMDSENKKHEN